MYGIRIALTQTVEQIKINDNELSNYTVDSLLAELGVEVEEVVA